MPDPARPNLIPVLRISFPHEDRLGRGKMELLEHIRETGSISAAGRAMDMSYRRAWLLVSDMNRMFKQPVVRSQRGGQKEWRCCADAVRRRAACPFPPHGGNGSRNAGERPCLA